MVEASFGSELILAALLDEMHTLVHFTLKTHVKHAVSLINDDVIEVFEPDVLSVLQMVQEAAWGAR